MASGATTADAARQLGYANHGELRPRLQAVDGEKAWADWVSPCGYGV